MLKRTLVQYLKKWVVTLEAKLDKENSVVLKDISELANSEPKLIERNPHSSKPIDLEIMGIRASNIRKHEYYPFNLNTSELECLLRMYCTGNNTNVQFYVDTKTKEIVLGITNDPLHEDVLTNILRNIFKYSVTFGSANALELPKFRSNSNEPWQTIQDDSVLIIRPTGRETTIYRDCLKARGLHALPHSCILKSSDSGTSRLYTLRSMVGRFIEIDTTGHTLYSYK